MTQKEIKTKLNEYLLYNLVVERNPNQPLIAWGFGDFTLRVQVDDYGYTRFTYLQRLYKMDKYETGS